MKRITAICCLSAVLALVTTPAHGAGKKPNKAWIDPDTARQEDPDFSIQGEYGSANLGAATGVQVVALGGGKFTAYVLQGGLPGLG